MEESFDFLIRFQNEPIKNLNILVKNNLKEFKKKYRKANPTQKTRIEQKIQASPRPSIIEHNTIGAYFYGCYQNYYGDVDKKNSILCYGSIGSDVYTPDRQLWVCNKKKPTRFRQLNYPDSFKYAYIYIGSDFDKFTREEIEMFKNYGITKATILKTHNMKHSIYNEYSGVELDHLPQNHKIETGTILLTRNKKNKSGLIIFIIFLIIIFILFVLVARYYANKTDISVDV